MQDLSGPGIPSKKLDIKLTLNPVVILDKLTIENVGRLDNVRVDGPQPIRCLTPAMNVGRLDNVQVDGPQPIRCLTPAMMSVEDNVRTSLEEFERLERRIQMEGLKMSEVYLGYSQGDARFGDAAGRQCQCCSFFAAVFGFVQKKTLASEQDLELILTNGSLLYLQGNMSCDRHGYTSAIELPGLVKICAENYSFRFIDPIVRAIEMHQETSLMAKLKILFDEDKCIAALLTTQHFTRAILRVNAVFILYDSHAVDERGCSWLVFGTIENAYAFYVYKYDIPPTLEGEVECIGMMKPQTCSHEASLSLSWNNKTAEVQFQEAIKLKKSQEIYLNCNAIYYPILLMLREDKIFHAIKEKVDSSYLPYTDEMNKLNILLKIYSELRLNKLENLQRPIEGIENLIEVLENIKMDDEYLFTVYVHLSSSTLQNGIFKISRIDEVIASSTLDDHVKREIENYFSDSIHELNITVQCPLYLLFYSNRLYRTYNFAQTRYELVAYLDIDGFLYFNSRNSTYKISDSADMFYILLRKVNLSDNRRKDAVAVFSASYMPWKTFLYVRECFRRLAVTSGKREAARCACAVAVALRL